MCSAVPYFPCDPLPSALQEPIITTSKFKVEKKSFLIPDGLSCNSNYPGLTKRMFNSVLLSLASHNTAPSPMLSSSDDVE